ncbi:MAG: Hsp20/alpha crystallin family protein [bacterium]|nr:Hsp20/alpha crystallin family protein [bacterium]
MASFFDKLKSSMGVQEEEIDEEEEKEEEEKPKQTKKKGEGKKKVEVKASKQEKEEEKETAPAEQADAPDWFEPEGELAVDVYQTDEDIVIQSTIAGVKPEDLDISIEDDTVTVSGERKNVLEDKGKNYFYQE